MDPRGDSERTGRASRRRRRRRRQRRDNDAAQRDRTHHTRRNFEEFQEDNLVIHPSLPPSSLPALTGPKRTVIYERVFRRGDLSGGISALPISVHSPTRYRSSFYARARVRMYKLKRRELAAVSRSLGARARAEKK